jgi:hypothetical protein
MLKNFFFGLKKSSYMNKFSPSESRQGAFEYFKDRAEKALKKGETEKFNETILIILERFTIAASNSIKDAEEKNYVKEYLISLGVPVVEPVKHFIKKSSVVAYPIEILSALVSQGQLLEFLDGVLTTEDTLFDDPIVEKRIEILKHFAGLTYSNVLSKVGTYFADSDDRLVIASIRFVRDYVFSDNDSDMEAIQEILTNKFIDEETSMRIKIELLNVFIDQEWKISSSRKRFEELLPNGYFINAQGYLKVINTAVKARED